MAVKYNSPPALPCALWCVDSARAMATLIRSCRNMERRRRSLSGGGHFLCRRLHRVRRPSSTAEVSHKRQPRSYAWVETPGWWWWCGQCVRGKSLSINHDYATNSGGRTSGSLTPGVPATLGLNVQEDGSRKMLQNCSKNTLLST